MVPPTGYSGQLGPQETAKTFGTDTGSSPKWASLIGVIDLGRQCEDCSRGVLWRELNTYKTFTGIWFTPGQYYEGQPESDFVNRYNSGLDEAKGFLEGRISDLSETLELDKPRAFPAKSDSRKIFVVHGHDHGRK